MPDDPGELVTALIGKPSGTDAVPDRRADVLLPLVYEQLRRLAQSYLSREERDHTLQPTALVHEAYLRLVDQTRVDWRGRTHFFAVGAQAMRRVLCDHARRRGSAKRGGSAPRVRWRDELDAGAEIDLDQVLAVDEALRKLAALDPRQARIVELRFFGGLTVEEVAALLEVSRRTVEGDWTHARAWLERELSRPDGT